jgi:succinoglycan biosynthesis protein ExoM
MPQRHHICVCLCTYQRPKRLSRILLRLEEQETQGLFTYSVVVVDNDRTESGREVVESYARQSRIPVHYDVEPRQNIALARNKTIENATGNLIAFIDDDEFPLDNWLLNLFKALICFESDGVLGPVIPYFEKEPPKWILKGRLFERPIHLNGHLLDWNNTRTGNALLRREVFTEGRDWFDPVFGKGGEDQDFFARKIEAGHIFVWCNDAPVFETIPAERWEGTALLKKALVRGGMTLNAEKSKRISVLKSAVAITAYTSCLPVSFLLGHHVVMNYLVKICDHIGKILAFLGIHWIK